MSVVMVDEVRVMVVTPLEDSDLQDVIDREEAWLARRVGPLTGSRILTITEPDRSEPIRLPRPATTVTVTDNAVTVTVTLVGEQYVIRAARNLWLGPVAITFTPNDELEVRRVVIELVRRALSESPYQSERIGDYSYDRGTGGTVSRQSLARSLMTGAARTPHTVLMTSEWAS